MTDFVNQFVENLEYMRETKNKIKDAIIEKGVEVLDEDTFRSYAEKISDISTSPTYNVIGINTSGTGNAKVEGTFVIPEGKKTAIIIAVVNSQGVNVFNVIDGEGLAKIDETIEYDKVDSYNNSVAVGHTVKTYKITTDGRQTTINVTLGDGGSANRFAMAIGIY